MQHTEQQLEKYSFSTHFEIRQNKTNNKMMQVSEFLCAKTSK